MSQAHSRLPFDRKAAALIGAFCAALPSAGEATSSTRAALRRDLRLMAHEPEAYLNLGAPEAETDERQSASLFTSVIPLVLAFDADDQLDERLSALCAKWSADSTLIDYAAAFSMCMLLALRGQPLKQSLRDVSAASSAEMGQQLTHALNHYTQDPDVMAQHFGRGAQPSAALPLSFHILTRSQNFEEAAQINAAIGGDIGARGVIIGALYGASYGIETPCGIPLAQILYLDEGAEIWKEIRAFSATSERAD